jgi:hypothetical protein
MLSISAVSCLPALAMMAICYDAITCEPATAVASIDSTNTVMDGSNLREAQHCHSAPEAGTGDWTLVAGGPAQIGIRQLEMAVPGGSDLPAFDPSLDELLTK